MVIHPRLSALIKYWRLQSCPSTAVASPIDQSLLRFPFLRICHAWCLTLCGRVGDLGFRWVFPRRLLRVWDELGVIEGSVVCGLVSGGGGGGLRCTTTFCLCASVLLRAADLVSELYPPSTPAAV